MSDDRRHAQHPHQPDRSGAVGDGRAAITTLMIAPDDAGRAQPGLQPAQRHPGGALLGQADQPGLRRSLRHEPGPEPAGSAGRPTAYSGQINDGTAWTTASQTRADQHLEHRPARPRADRGGRQRRQHPVRPERRRRPRSTSSSTRSSRRPTPSTTASTSSRAPPTSQPYTTGRRRRLSGQQRQRRGRHPPDRPQHDVQVNADLSSVLGNGQPARRCRRQAARRHAPDLGRHEERQRHGGCRPI